MASATPARKFPALRPAGARARIPPAIAASAKPTSASRIPLWCVRANSGMPTSYLPLLVGAVLPEEPTHGGQDRERDDDRRDDDDRDRLITSRGYHDLGEDLDRVAVREDVVAADALALEAGGRAPDPRAAAALGELVVDRPCDVDDARRRPKRYGIVVGRPVVAGGKGGGAPGG